MAKVTTIVRYEKEDLIRLVKEDATKQLGGPFQGSSVIQFIVPGKQIEDLEKLNAVVEFNGKVEKR